MFFLVDVIVKPPMGHCMKRQNIWVLILLAAAFLSSCSTVSRQAASTGPTMVAGPPPADAEALWRQAEMEHKAGNAPLAISLWERIIQNYPDNAVAAKALHKVGTIYLSQGNPERALQYFEYLLYTYPKWEGVHLAQLDRLRAFWMTGKKKQVMKEATPLWEASAGEPEVQVGLARLMTTAYGSEREIETGFDWATAGFTVARSPEEKKQLTQAVLELLKGADEGTVNKLAKKNPSDFMKVFLDFHLLRLAMLKGQSDIAREEMRGLATRNPTHPLTPEIQMALRGAPSEVEIPLNPNRVGCLIPMNGPYAKYGRMVMRGLSSAIEDWNERHSDQRISLIARDAQSESDQAIKSFNELARKEGVLAIIGPLGAQSAKAVSPLANQMSMPLLALTQKEEESGDDSFVLHIFLDNRDLVRTLVRYCREKLGFSRFAALYPDDRYGQKLSKVFADVVKEQGATLLANVSYKEKSTDFKEPIQKLITVAKQNAPLSGTEATPFDALFIPDQVQTVSLIAPQLPYYNVVGTTLLGTNLWGEGPLVQAGGSYVEQALFATPYYAESQSPTVRSFREKYQAAYHTSPSYLEAQAYDAMMLFLEARFSMRASSIERGALLQNLLQIRGYKGVAGVYSFTPEGNLERDYQLLQVVNGQLVQISP